MSTEYHIALLRLTDAAGEQLVAACVTQDGAPVLGMGEEEGWLSQCSPKTSVVIDGTAIVQLTDHRDVSALAAWLSAASVWLQIQQQTSKED